MLLKSVNRYMLVITLGLIAAYLVAGGGYLIALGGSPYYAIAGLAIAVAAVLVARRDDRAVWVYGAMLGGTLIWSLGEVGGEAWGIQARLLAPTVLFVWVAWSHKPRLGILLAVLLVTVGGVASLVTRDAAIEGDTPLPQSTSASMGGGWPHYGNDVGGSRFSPLTGIDRHNVSGLKEAWTYHTGVKAGIGFEATPIMAEERLFACTANNIIFALDPDTGKRQWLFDPKAKAPASAVCRGVAFFRARPGNRACDARIIFATTDARLMAVDAASGVPCADFGTAGTVDLRRGMGEVRDGYYYVSSAPAVVNGRVVLGGFVLDGQMTGEPSGVVRAFDASDGRLLWAWDMDRPDAHGAPPEGQSYSRGTANSWAPMSGDEALGLVYVPVGNATPDFWGAHRSPGSEKYSSSVVALDLSSGTVRWHYQTVHHDLWDYDVAAQPTLIDLKKDGERVPALLLATKRGQIFLLDRRTGKPLAAVEERPVPQGAAPGDFVSPTQPFSTGMPSFDDTVLTEASMWGATPLDQLWCRITFRQARYDGPLTPPGTRTSINYPSYLGGVNWGGVSVDPERQLMVVNWNRMANLMTLLPRKDVEYLKPMGGSSLHQGLAAAPQIGTPFAAASGPFLSPLGIPCTSPPFGKIAVVELNTRKVVWQKPLGTSADSGPLGMRSGLAIPMGVPNIGGSVTTRGGLIFIAATQERVIRAIDLQSGKILWSARLPAAGHATPMTYASARTGRQFVVIAAGGNAILQSGASDSLVAFALPETAGAGR